MYVIMALHHGPLARLQRWHSRHMYRLLLCCCWKELHSCTAVYNVQCKTGRRHSYFRAHSNYSSWNSIHYVSWQLILPPNDNTPKIKIPSQSILSFGNGCADCADHHVPYSHVNFSLSRFGLDGNISVALAAFFVDTA